MALAEIAPNDRRTGSGPSQGRVDLAVFHERSSGLPVAGFVVVFAAWLALLATGLLLDGIAVRVLLLVPLTLASGQLFMIGHDAAHGSHAPSRWANGVIGRLALLPSLHVFGLWREHHGTHHRYTNLASRDFVWTPLSPEAYRALSRSRRRWYRVCRHESGVGLGAYYALEIWLPRMLWPRDRGLRSRRDLRGDSVGLAVMVATVGFLAGALVGVARPERVADPTFWATAVAFLFLAPLIATHWMIGWVVFFNHTHPEIVWYDDVAEWSRRDVQLEGSAGVVVRGVRNFVWPRRIMSHTAHHVDPGVPLRHLAAAQREVERAAGDRVVAYRWSVGELRSILASCKLYDFGSRTWVGYEPESGG